MPDRDAAERQSARQLTAMIWAGVGLVPVAVLIVLVGGGDRSLRFAVLLMAVSVVLVGASLLIRNDPELLRMDVADRVADQTDALRDELREEVAAAARATHHRVQALQDEVARLQRDRLPSAAVWPGPDPAALDPSRGHLPGAGAPAATGAVGAVPPAARRMVTAVASAATGAVGATVPAARGAVTGAAPVPRPSGDRDARRPAGTMGTPTGVGRGREVAGPGQSVPVRGPAPIPVARAAAAVRPIGGSAAVPATVPVGAPVDRPAGGSPGQAVPAPGGRRTRADDVRRPRRGERRGRRSADRDSEGLDAAPSSWLAEPDSGWLIRPGEDVGVPSEPPDEVPWTSEREPARRHRSPDAYDTDGTDVPRYGAAPGRRRRREADEAHESW